MFTKEMLENALEEVKKERDWILLETAYIGRLSHAVKNGDYGRIKKFERKAARAERKIHSFEERVIRIINYLRQRFPAWNHALSEIERQTKIFDENILKKVSLIGGTIPPLIKEKNLDQISVEVDKVMDGGVRPLIALLNHLYDQLEKRFMDEKAKEKQLPPELESQLDKQPFLIVFHSANEMAMVNRILAMSHSLPDNYIGRFLQYAFEVDYFWIEHNGKMHGFFGHVPHYLTRRDIYKSIKFWDKTTKPNKMLLEMRHGTYTGISKKLSAALYRKGLLLPEWLLSKVGIIKLIVEIKSGMGDDIRALDELVRIIKENNLQNSIIFLAFQARPLEYLKQRLPHAFTIHMIIKKIPFLKKTSFIGFSYSPLINCFSAATKGSEKANLEQIKHADDSNKVYIDWKVLTKEHLDILVRHGGRGAIIWQEPETIVEWLRNPPSVEQ
tara:strand:- start:1351 stop:2679 length:1329 start_codon:yes stop_codon:yes gene_type:complete